MKKTKRFIIAIAVILCLWFVFVGVSHIYYGRSVMGTFSEIFLLITDRDDMFETEDGFRTNLNLHSQTQESEEKYTIPTSVKLSCTYDETDFDGMQVFYTSVDSLQKSDTAVFYFHGGAFINDAIEEHWNLIDKIAKETELPVIVPLYPKLPTYNSEYTYSKMIEFYSHTIKQQSQLKHVVFIGDSSGGNMALSLAKQLREYEILQPEKLILIAPWLDVSMQTEGISEIAEYDPMLGLYGIKKLGEMWAGSKELTDSTVSPIYGSNNNLGEITIFASTRDMLYPDIKKYSEILTNEGIVHTLIEEKGLNHPYVLFPTPEAKKAQEHIINLLK